MKKLFIALGAVSAFTLGGAFAALANYQPPSEAEITAQIQAQAKQKAQEQAQDDARSEQDRQRVWKDMNIDEGAPLCPQLADYALRLKFESMNGETPRLVPIAAKIDVGEFVAVASHDSIVLYLGSSRGRDASPGEVREHVGMACVSGLAAGKQEEPLYSLYLEAKND